MPRLQHLVVEDFKTAASPASALQALGQLSQLRVLKVLHWVSSSDPHEHTSLLHAAPVGGLSALTASSQLQRLHVSCLAQHSTYGSALPDGAAAHMFPQGKLLPQLWSLHLGPEKADCMTEGCITGPDLECIAHS